MIVGKHKAEFKEKTISVSIIFFSRHIQQHWCQLGPEEGWICDRWVWRSKWKELEGIQERFHNESLWDSISWANIAYIFKSPLCWFKRNHALYPSTYNSYGKEFVPIFLWLPSPFVSFLFVLIFLIRKLKVKHLFSPIWGTHYVVILMTCYGL